MKILTKIIVCFALINFEVNAEPHLEGHHHEHMKPIEIGVSVEAVRIDEEGEQNDVLGAHLHLIKKFSEIQSLENFGYGLGSEILFAAERHYSIMASLAYFPYDEFAIIISPGVEFAKHDGETERQFSMHYELTYSFTFKNFHFGPAISFSNTKESKHYGVGIHFGL